MIKEVANVYFEALADDPAANIYKGDIVLFLDTLKVSTIETTAEQTDATGGWGNPKLITWDYGKEITLTLEDALMSLESLRFMMGGAIKRSKPASSDSQTTIPATKVLVHRTEEVVAGDNGVIPLPVDHITKATLYPEALTGHPIRFINYGGGTDSATAGTRTQVTSGKMEAPAALKFKNTAMGVAEETLATKGDHIRIFWVEEVDEADSAIEVTISPSTFPGTYRVVGDTFMRSQKTGKDEAFQFVIGKAKVSSEVTLTLEAEGDPTTFEMTLTVLRDTNEAGEAEMMKLIRYGDAAADGGTTGDDIGSLT